MKVRVISAFLLGMLSIGNSHAQYCVANVWCWCTDYLKIDRGWGPFDGAGDARYWYDAASGRGYSVGRKPMVGAILVWDAWGENSAGHVAEITNILSSTSAELTHSNWADPMDGQVRSGTVHAKTDEDGNWTSVRVNNGGYVNVLGFIYPKEHESTPPPGTSIQAAHEGGIAWTPYDVDCPSASNWYAIEYTTSGTKFFPIASRSNQSVDGVNLCMSYGVNSCIEP